MKRQTLLLAAALLVLPASLAAQSSASADASATASATAARSADEQAVRAALEHYLLGHATGDPEHFRAIFHPDSKLLWMREGQLATRTSAEYIAGASGRPAPDEAQRRRWIESVDVTGDAAVAKIILDYPTVLMTDYMTLLRIDGEWKIINKSFNVQPKNR